MPDWFAKLTVITIKLIKPVIVIMMTVMIIIIILIIIVSVIFYQKLFKYVSVIT